MGRGGGAPLRDLAPPLAAVLLAAVHVHVGVVMATAAAYLLASQPPRMVFLVGILPTFVTLWIRRAVLETEAWQAARTDDAEATPRWWSLEPRATNSFA